MCGRSSLGLDFPKPLLLLSSYFTFVEASGNLFVPQEPFQKVRFAVLLRYMLPKYFAVTADHRFESLLIKMRVEEENPEGFLEQKMFSVPATNPCCRMKEECTLGIFVGV